MRSLISLSLLFLAAVLSTATQASILNEPAQCNAESCSSTPPSDFPVISKIPGMSATPLDGNPLTNAQRLTRGLPLNPPRRASAVAAARRAQVSPAPQVTYTGVIQVFSDTTSLGYIAPDLGFYSPQLTSDISTALSVTFQLNVGATSGSQLSLTELNDSRGLFFGLVQGGTTSNIGTGSSSYLYLDPVSTSTSPGSTPQSVSSFYGTQAAFNVQAETSVWSVDLTTGALTAQWINSDGSMPATIFFVLASYILAGGDAAVFQAQYTVTLQFVPM